MKKNLLLFYLIISSVSFSFSQAPAFAWVKSSASLANPSLQNVGGLIVDTIHQCIYATASFEGNINFGSGDLEGDALSPFLVKYDLNGSLVWAKAFKSSLANKATGGGVDNIGNVYITGYSENDTVRFGNFYLLNNQQGSTDHTVGYVVKFDSNGNPLWVKGSANGGVICNAIAVDAAGNSFITGHVTDASGTFMGTATNEGAFFAKINTNGNLDWLKQTTPSFTLIAQGTSIAIDKAGDCVVTGVYAASINFGSIAVTHSGNGSWNRFITKINPLTGSFTWAKGAGSVQGADYVYDIATDRQNNIYLSGFTSVPTPGGSSSFAAKQFVEKLNPAGTSQWINTYDQTLLSLVSSVVTDKYDNVYATFNISDTTVFGSYTVSPMSPLIPNATIITAIVKLNSAGTVLYTKSTTDPVALSWSPANSTAVDAAGNLYIHGSIYNECKFDNIDFQPENNHTEFSLAKLGNASNGNGNGGGGNGGNGTVGIKTQTASQKQFVYPNPAADLFYIANITESSLIKIISINGAVVLETHVNTTENKIDVSLLSNGIYVLELSTAGATSHQKIIVDKH